MTARRDQPFPLNFSTSERPTGPVPRSDPLGNRTDLAVPAFHRTGSGLSIPFVRAETVFWVIIFTSLAGGLFGCFYTF